MTRSHGIFNRLEGDNVFLLRILFFIALGGKYSDPPLPDQERCPERSGPAYLLEGCSKQIVMYCTPQGPRNVALQPVNSVPLVGHKARRYERTTLLQRPQGPPDRRRLVSRLDIK